MPKVEKVERVEKVEKVFQLLFAPHFCSLLVPIVL